MRVRVNEGYNCNVTAAERTVEAKPDKAQPSSELSHSEISHEHQVKSQILL